MEKQTPSLRCEFCGSLNVAPDRPKQDLKHLDIHCLDCGKTFEIEIKVKGVSDDGVLQVDYVPSLVMRDKAKDYFRKYFSF